MECDTLLLDWNIIISLGLGVCLSSDCSEAQSSTYHRRNIYEQAEKSIPIVQDKHESYASWEKIMKMTTMYLDCNYNDKMMSIATVTDLHEAFQGNEIGDESLLSNKKVEKKLFLFYFYIDFFII